MLDRARTPIAGGASVVRIPTATEQFSGENTGRFIKLSYRMGYNVVCLDTPFQDLRLLITSLRGKFFCWGQSQHESHTAARMAALAEEADNDEEREHFTRVRDAWITLANRCEFLDIPDVTEE